MDCTIVSGRIAAFLDGELAPADTERFTLHIESCSTCSELVIEMEAQLFAPLSADEKRAICGREEFWSDMDSVLGTHIDQMVLAKTACVGPWHTRRVAMTVPTAVAYAAAMVLAVAWGLVQQDRAQSAELASEHLGQQLEQERRLAAQPVEQAGGSGKGAYKVVTYTPERGTF